MLESRPTRAYAAAAKAAREHPLDVLRYVGKLPQLTEMLHRQLTEISEKRNGTLGDRSMRNSLDDRLLRLIPMEFCVC
jgi:hypothetical protein